MAATLCLRNISATKRLLRRALLERLANRICAGEKVGGSVEISLLLCDDEFISRLNRQYRDKEGPTDVLSFEQDGPEGSVLGDVVISLETALRRSDGDRAGARKEVDLLFCHGLLHLLGYDHSTRSERERMTRKQAKYLGISECAAWPSSRPALRASLVGSMQAAWR
ncbi:MAG: rRNA maturation RNase YbeY [Candidatus Hydrogenedentes bacterium]|nr:rRNA maturation RNase YbeY [Candidatus Hydrogenedentota bacterium]